MTYDPYVRQREVREDEDVFFAEQWQKPDGTYFGAADFGVPPLFNWDLRVFDADALNVTPVFTLLAQTTGFGPLTNDAYWNGEDAIGYNFLFRVAPATFRFIGGKRYVLEWTVYGAFLGSTLRRFKVTELSVAGVLTP